jgi:hypothetical protein
MEKYQAESVGAVVERNEERADGLVDVGSLVVVRELAK